jgi:hypothetical protein
VFTHSLSQSSENLCVCPFVRLDVCLCSFPLLFPSYISVSRLLHSASVRGKKSGRRVLEKSVLQVTCACVSEAIARNGLPEENVGREASGSHANV